MKLAYAGDRKRKPDLFEFRTLTREEVLALKYGDHQLFVRTDGKVGTVKINGAVRTWKRDAQRVEIPVKYGMYEYATLGLAEAMRRFVVPVSNGQEDGK